MTVSFLTECRTYGRIAHALVARLFNIEHSSANGSERTLTLIVKNNAQKGGIDVDAVAVILNEAHLSEFAHEEINARARGPNHFRQRLLRYFGKYGMRFVPFTIAGK